MALTDMIVIGRGPIDTLQGFEPIGRAARLILANGLNDAIDRIQNVWINADQQLESYGMDVGVRDAGVEHVDIRNIFQGPHKSLAASPIDRFPNVSVTAYATRPSAQNALADHLSIPELSLLVEIMVKAGPIVPGEELLYESIVHRRIERTSEAVLSTIKDSRNLLATADGISEPRGGIVNASWTRNEAIEGETGSMYILHASRFTYALVRRISMHT